MDANSMEDILKSINTSNDQIASLTNFVRGELQQAKANTDSLSHAVRQITSDLNVLKANWQAGQTGHESVSSEVPLHRRNRYDEDDDAQSDKKNLRPLTSACLYDGSTGSKFETHISRMLDLKLLMRLNDRDACKLLKTSFTHRASEITNTVEIARYLDEENGLDEYINELRSRFVPKQNSRIYRAKLYQFKQGSSDIITFYSDLLSLFKQAYPDETVSTSRLAKDTFANGLRDASTRKRVLEKDENDATLETLLNAALDYTAIQIQVRKNQTISDDSIPMEINTINQTQSPGQPQSAYGWYNPRIPFRPMGMRPSRPPFLHNI